MTVMLRLRHALLALVCALVTSAAWSQGEPQNLAATTLKVGMHSIRAQLAITPQQRQIGLMHRREMPSHEGMLFVFDEPSR